MDPLVFEHLDASDRNLTIAADLMEHPVRGFAAPAYEWVVVVSFYSAVRCVNAYLVFRNGVEPRTHMQRTRAVKQISELEPVLAIYTRLENWSRQARYTRSYTDFDEVSSQTALNSAHIIREHVQSLMRSGE